MKFSTRFQLSFMMFMNFFVWGAWFVTMGTFSEIHSRCNRYTGWPCIRTQSLGAIIAPFIIGLIADQYFSAQKILGLLHLAGAAILLLYFFCQMVSRLFIPPYLFT